MDIIDTRPNLVAIPVLLERLKQLHVALASLDGDNISIKSLDGGEDIVEVTIAEMGVCLCAVRNTSGGETERVHSPCQVGVPVRSAERESFTDSGLVNLNGINARLFKIDDLISESKSDLLSLDFSGDVGARETPVQDRHGTSEHTLHGLLGYALCVRAPADGHGLGTSDVRNDDGWTDITRSVGLDPCVRGEDEALEQFAKVLDHVVSLWLAVHEEIKTDFLLEFDDAVDLFLDEFFVLLRGELFLAELGTGLADLLCLLFTY
jgi:hypothetical protein